MKVRSQLHDSDFLAGLVTADSVRVAETPPELRHRLQELVKIRATEDFPPADIKEAIRALLRRGGFKAAGRNKPASEYLAQAALEGRFPFINNLVDVNNFLSLQCGLPISLLDRSVLGSEAVIRYGAPGDHYVFNRGGQALDLGGLICVCAAESGTSVPLGTPIKDSMRGKVQPQTVAVLGVIYASVQAIRPEDMEQLAGKFAELLREFGGAACTHTQVLRG
jgi:DNA/RNA-binding domain of Phe-tRNA-synthetase-like protein